MKNNQNHQETSLSVDETHALLIDAMCKDKSPDVAFALCCTMLMAVLKRIDADFGRERVFATLNVAAAHIDEGAFDRAPKMH